MLKSSFVLTDVRCQDSAVVCSIIPPPTWIWNSRFQQAASFFMGRYSISAALYRYVLWNFWNVLGDKWWLLGADYGRTGREQLFMFNFASGTLLGAGSSRITFFLRCPYKHQAAGCLPMTHTKAGYNRVCRLCHTVWCGVVTQCDSKMKCKTLCQSLLSKHSLLLTIPRCKKLFTQVSHALLVCPSVRSYL